ncbi:MAG: 2'-5' RNA ligase family protein, partial [Thermoleophilaceae bacterium]
MSGPRARMFVALDLPSEARRELSEWRDVLIDGRRDLRPVRAEALHVTLVFLGWQDELAAEDI